MMARIGSLARLGRPGSAARARHCRASLAPSAFTALSGHIARRACDYNIDAVARFAPPGD